jgi:hypothetical protein
MHQASPGHQASTGHQASPGNLPESDAVMRRLRRLEDIEAARCVVTRYAAVIDSRELASLGDVFSADAELVTPWAHYRGIDEIRGFFTDALTRSREQRSHFVTNIEPTWIAPGEVRLHSYFLYVGAGGAASTIGWGTYEDRVRVDDDTALITFKSIALGRQTDLRQGWSGSSAKEAGSHESR